MALSKAVLTIAARLSRQAEANYAEYLEECESYRRDGYRPHHCEHGTNMWTDYDNICGPCEDGMSMGDGVTRREWAIDSAKRRDAEARNIIKAAQTLSDLRIDLDWGPVWRRVNDLLAV